MGLLAIHFLFMESVFCEQLSRYYYLFQSGFINNSIPNNFTNFVFMCVTDKEGITN
jgi:hypothetical protein